MSTTGTCSKGNTNCKSDHFCPTTDTASVICIPCTENMKFGQGCYCVDDTVITNCKTCSGDNCSKCLPGAFLSNNFCDSCAKGCSECTDVNTCQMCADGFTMEGGTCARICDNNQDCGDQATTFCDASKQRCVQCSTNCTLCQSATFCNACDGTTHITTIAGQCTLNCADIEDGKYCKNGTATACAEGIDSACQCGVAGNCASCNTELNACDTCLPNVVKGDDGTCNTCAVGYKFIGDMCWPEENSGEGNRIGTGAIVGIVVGVLVVVGAVAGGLAYYFVRRAKKRVEQQ